jgi:hypothetical protein
MPQAGRLARGVACEQSAVTALAAPASRFNTSRAAVHHALPTAQKAPRGAGLVGLIDPARICLNLVTMAESGIQTRRQARIWLPSSIFTWPDQ